MKYIKVTLAENGGISYIYSDSIIMIIPYVKIDDIDGLCTGVSIKDVKNLKSFIYVRESPYEIFRQMKKKGVCMDI